MSDPGCFEIRSGYSSMDFRAVTSMLSKAYWSLGIGMDEVKTGAAHSAVVAGAFMGSRQVAYVRVVSDTVRFAYVLDMYVEEAFRGRGMARALMEYLLACPELSEVYQWLLISRDAKGLYEKLGFKPLSRAGDMLEIRHSRPPRS